MPLVENIATLIDPPASKLSEADWTSEILAAANSALLLDLHNLYANSVNFGFDPYAFINRMPHEQIHAIHVAGGRWIKAKTTGERRLLDDHMHDVPDSVYDLLKYVGQKTFRPLTVILERDGRYPPIEMLLNQLDRARNALRGGRAQAAIRGRMSAQKLELFLTKLYVDDQARSRFLANPRREALNAGLNEDDCAALEKIDFIGLELAADSSTPPPPRSRSNLRGHSAAGSRIYLALKAVVRFSKENFSVRFPRVAVRSEPS